MTSTTETKRLQTDRDRAVRRRLRAGVVRLGGYLGWDRERVVQFSEATAGRPWRRCDRTALVQVLGAFAEDAARVRVAGQVTPIDDSTNHELVGVGERLAAGPVGPQGGGKPSVSSH